MKRYKITPTINSIREKRWSLFEKKSWWHKWVRITDCTEKKVLEELVDHLASDEEVVEIETRKVR